MKRLLIGGVGLSLLLTLTACGGQQPAVTPAPAETVEAAEIPEATRPPKPTRPPRPESTQAPVYDDSLVELVFALNGPYYFDSGEEAEFDVKVPHLRAEGPDAEALNRELEEVWLEQAQRNAILYRSCQTPEIFQMGYETHWNGSLLSLIMWSATPYWEANRQVYNYDFATDSWVQGYELAHYCGLEPEELKAAVSRAAAAYFDSHPEQVAAEGGDLAQLRARAVSRESVEATRLWLEEGKVRGVAEMPWDFTYEPQLMEVETDRPESVEMTIDSDWVSAELKDHRVTLTFHDVNSAMWILSDGLRFETPYEVEGLYGTYTDMAMGLLGMEFRPFLFLTDTAGRVTCCNIMACAETGDRFFASGPLEDVYDVVYYDYGVEELGEAGEVPTIYAHTKVGEDISLNQPAYATTRHIPQQLKGTVWTSDGKDSQLRLGTDVGEQSVRWTHDGRDYDGWVTCLGTNGEGMHFRLQLWTDLSDAAQCWFTLPCPGEAEDVNNTLDVQHCSGPQVPGIANGGVVTLYDGMY